MKSYVPLKTAKQEDDFTVGVKASILSHLEKEFTVPFSLVITSDAFFEFITYNTLGEQVRNFIEAPLPKIEQVKAFAQLSRDFEKATFPGAVLNQLRECFELLCLDANNLEDLSRASPAIKQILSLRRSTNYEDIDNLCPGIILTKNNFDWFIKSIKSVYLSAFAPSSIEFREKQKVKDFSLSVIVSRLPEMATCFEATLEEDKNLITVHSYVGFIDRTGLVPRDEFKLDFDFLRVIERNMQKQRIVAVFDMEANRPSTKQYMTMNAANSAEEPLILEISRLSKKIQQALQHERVKVEYVTDKHNNIYLLDLTILPKPEEKQETLVEVEEKPPVNEDILTLAHALRTFLQTHSYGEFGSEVEAALLELREPNVNNLQKAFDLCVQLIK